MQYIALQCQGVSCLCMWLQSHNMCETTPRLTDCYAVCQVVGLTSGFKTLAVLSNLSPRVHGKRIAQAEEVLLSFSSSGTCFMHVKQCGYARLAKLVLAKGSPCDCHVFALGSASPVACTKLYIRYYIM
jgi:hypothetical protein